MLRRLRCLKREIRSLRRLERDLREATEGLREEMRLSQARYAIAAAIPAPFCEFMDLPAAAATPANA